MGDINEIDALKPRGGGIAQTFTKTVDAIASLVRAAGYSLKEIAEAFDAWDDLALDF